MAELMLRQGTVLPRGMPTVCVVCGCPATLLVRRHFGVRLVPAVDAVLQTSELPVCGWHRYHWIWWHSVGLLILPAGIGLAVWAVAAFYQWLGPVALVFGPLAMLVPFAAWCIGFGRLIGKCVVKTSRLALEEEFIVVLENVSPQFKQACTLEPDKTD